MDRRGFLTRAARFGFAAAALPSAALLQACAGAPRAPSGPALARGDDCARSLKPVRVAAEREIRTVVGLRPYRPSGFVVRVETSGDTRIVHNYGHGGSGITLSWGTSRLAVDLGAPGHRGPVAVVGCGAVGLSNARLLQEAGFAVTIYAKALPPQTTSNIAGGQWFPAFLYERAHYSDAFERQLLAASEFAYRRFQIMVGPRFGVRWMRNYYLSDREFHEDGLIGERSPLRAMMPEYRRLAPRENPFGGFAFARRFDGMIIEPPVYLAAMLDEFLVAGGRLVLRDFAEPGEIVQLPEKLVFNCTGLGAKALFDDDELTPVRGQLTMLLPQPEVDYAVLSGNLYMFSRSDGIVLGGTHDEGEWSLEPDLQRKAQILAGHRDLFASLRGC
jgi:glycine/D-amino acid oxidase-like deaminating enzyme